MTNLPKLLKRDFRLYPEVSFVFFFSLFFVSVNKMPIRDFHFAVVVVVCSFFFHLSNVFSPDYHI